jgi:hypothetical protein
MSGQEDVQELRAAIVAERAATSGLLPQEPALIREALGFALRALDRAEAWLTDGHLEVRRMGGADLVNFPVVKAELRIAAAYREKAARMIAQRSENTPEG